MSDDLENKLTGTHANETSDSDDAKHVVTRSLTVHFALPATGTYNIPLMKADTKITLVAVSVIPDIALTANNTNYRTLTLGQGDEAATALTDYDSFTTEITGDGSWVSMTAKTFTIVESTDVLTKGQVLYLEVTAAASGVAILGAAVKIKYRLTN